MLIRDTDRGDVRIGPGPMEVDADGGALIHGLHDHHVHLRSLAAASASVDLHGARDLRRLTTGSGWLRAIGYHESIAGPLDRHVLDAVVGDRPVRVQHRSGELWVLSSAAARHVGLPEHHDGRLWRSDDWLRDRVPPPPLDLATVGAEAWARGVTAFTDTTPHKTAADVDQLVAAALPQQLHLMVPPDLDVDPHPRIVAAHHKLLLDDVTLPAVDELAHEVARAGRGIAAHCVTRLQLVAFLAAGPRPGDRIEHGAVIPEELIAEIARRRLTVVTQPNFVAERGAQYRRDVDPDDLPHLYRCRTLLDAGIEVRFGTDAPFGGADPWAAMRAAVGRDLNPHERVSPAEALDAFRGPGWCLLHVPLEVQLRELDAANVRATFA